MPRLPGRTWRASPSTAGAHVASAPVAVGPARPRASEPDTETLVEPETTTQQGFGWSVIVWDDPINLMSYVVYVLQSLFGYSREKATELMLEIHETGRSVVATTDREKGEYYVSRLHGYGLQATLEKASGSEDDD